MCAVLCTVYVPVKIFVICLYVSGAEPGFFEGRSNSIVYLMKAGSRGVAPCHWETFKFYWIEAQQIGNALFYAKSSINYNAPIVKLKYRVATW